MKKLSILTTVFVVILVMSAACQPGANDTRTPPETTPTPSVTPSGTSPISKEQAIETASNTLRPSIVVHAEIRAEIHGWYWEVIFDNLNAEAHELMPLPLKGPPAPPPGQTAPDPYPGIWKSVIITINAQTGYVESACARKAPNPGPYVSQGQAFQSARGLISRSWTADAAWVERAEAEAYLRGDTWIVLFWEKSSENNRISVSVDAVTGEAHGASRR